MSDVKCPYCGEDQEIHHDDGVGYEEDGNIVWVPFIAYEQECIHCGEPFKFTTHISFSYTVDCQDGDHDFKPFGAKWPGMFQCKKCDFYERR